MVLNLSQAIVYDIECVPNCFTFDMVMLNSDTRAVWEISEFRDDRKQLMEFFRYLTQNQSPMIGFKTLGYDYPIIHMLWKNPNVTNQQLYQKSQQIITGDDRFGHQIWASDRFAPQIDLFKLHHFDNPQKSTGLKTLQINMRSPNVVESSLPFDRPLTKQEIEEQLIPYGSHDTAETKRFAQFSMSAIDFRVSLIEQFGVDVLNWNDTKIGEQTVIRRLGDEVCYDRSSGSKRTRQTPRRRIALNDIIFPYIKFEHPEFNRILGHLRTVVLNEGDFKGSDGDVFAITTKGVLTGLSATINGVEYHYGLGGIHGSVQNRRIIATEEYPIIDIDVKSLYPSVIAVNELAPEHMIGTKFNEVYAQLPQERVKWQQQKGKKCTEANALKLASNGVYGKSNSIWSPFYDPQLTMSTTINGQLILSMLIEWLNKIPTVSIIQGNTDGITLTVQKNYRPVVHDICQQWEQFTKLTLEEVEYSKMFIKNVNAYVAVGMDGEVKLKKEYWTPDALDYHGSISESQPPAWHKRFDAVVSRRAAVAHMVDGVDIDQFIRFNTNPYDFCCAVKIRRSDKLLWGGIEQQRNTRFYISTDGHDLVKQLPAQGPVGAFKKANGVSDALYQQVMKETGGQWDTRVCTGNKSRYKIRESQIMAGYKVTIVNNIEHFKWENVNYDWYIREAEKLVIK